MTTKDTKLDNIELSVWGLREVGERVNRKKLFIFYSKNLRQTLINNKISQNGKFKLKQPLITFIMLKLNYFVRNTHLLLSLLIMGERQREN